VPIESVKRIILSKVGAWAAGLFIAFIASVAAFGQKAFDMAVASTSTVKELQKDGSRVTELERALMAFIEASAEVNPTLGEAIDRRRAHQDSAIAAEQRARARLDVLGRGR
jgi:hypothetical protein